MEKIYYIISQHFVIGIIAIPGGIGGSMFGSFLINKMEISCKRLLKYQVCYYVLFIMKPITQLSIHNIIMHHNSYEITCNAGNILYFNSHLLIL